MYTTGDHTGKIIEKCMNGDIQAQFILYKKYSRAMYNIAIRILNNKMDAEDILQESFITPDQVRRNSMYATPPGLLCLM